MAKTVAQWSISVSYLHRQHSTSKTTDDDSIFCLLVTLLVGFDFASLVINDLLVYAYLYSTFFGSLFVRTSIVASVVIVLLWSYIALDIVSLCWFR